MPPVVSRLQDARNARLDEEAVGQSILQYFQQAAQDHAASRLKNAVHSPIFLDEQQIQQFQEATGLEVYICANARRAEHPVQRLMAIYAESLIDAQTWRMNVKEAGANLAAAVIGSYGCCQSGKKIKRAYPTHFAQLYQSGEDEARLVRDVHVLSGCADPRARSILSDVAGGFANHRIICKDGVENCSAPAQALVFKNSIYDVTQELIVTGKQIGRAHV